MGALFIEVSYLAHLTSDRAINTLVRVAVQNEISLQNVKHGCHLTEDEYFVAFRTQLGKQLVQ